MEPRIEVKSKIWPNRFFFSKDRAVESVFGGQRFVLWNEIKEEEISDWGFMGIVSVNKGLFPVTFPKEGKIKNINEVMDFLTFQGLISNPLIRTIFKETIHSNKALGVNSEQLRSSESTS